MELNKNERGVKEHPILFKAEMVRAILDGRKTQTRRLNLKTKYAVGDRLWVKETTWWGFDGLDGEDFLGFVADGKIPYCPQPPEAIRGSSVFKVSSLFMRKQDSRIKLEIIALREEPLKAITEDDCIKEGAAYPCDHHGAVIPGVACENCMNTGWLEPPIMSFHSLWESINGEGSWNKNPTVKVITFKVVS